ncbi:MAG: hypothetical protein AAF732_03740 [Pseudomonadota bacterium]
MPCDATRCFIDLRDLLENGTAQQQHNLKLIVTDMLAAVLTTGADEVKGRLATALNCADEVGYTKDDAWRSSGTPNYANALECK